MPPIWSGSRGRWIWRWTGRQKRGRQSSTRPPAVDRRLGKANWACWSSASRRRPTRANRMSSGDFDSAIASPLMRGLCAIQICAFQIIEQVMLTTGPTGLHRQSTQRRVRDSPNRPAAHRDEDAQRKTRGKSKRFRYPARRKESTLRQVAARSYAYPQRERTKMVHDCGKRCIPALSEMHPCPQRAATPSLKLAQPNGNLCLLY